MSSSETNTIVTEKIDFLPNGDLDRTLPVLLSDNGKMSLQVWDQFCDKIDDIRGHSKVSLINGVNCGLQIVLIALLATGWMWIGGRWYFYAILGCALGLGCYTAVPVYIQHLHNGATSKMSNACASASNYDRDLTMKLVGKIPSEWYIEVGVRNPSDVEQGVVTVEAVPVTAEAVPVAASSSAPPRKYVKVNGTMTLNPDYKKWKETNQA